MLDITWFKGKYTEEKFIITESHSKIMEYDEFLDDEYVYNLVERKIKEGYYVQLNAI